MAYILNSPVFTGNPQAPTPTTADNSTSIATTAFVKAQGYGVGTVTAIGITTANGVSGSSSGGATPNLTITLGAITPTSVNGLTLAAAAQGFTIAGGTASKTMTFKNSLTIQGTDAAVLDIGGGGTLGSAAYTASSAYQAANTNLASIGALANSAGVLYNNGTGTFTYAVLGGAPQADSGAGSNGTGTTIALANHVHPISAAYEPALGNPGTNGWVLSSTTGGTRSWVAMSAGFADPMTSTGDIIYSSSNTPTPARLGIGTTGYVLTVVGGIPAWSNTPTLTGTNFSGIPESAVTNLTTDLGNRVLTSAVGAASGVCPLDGTGKVSTTYLPSAVLGALNYQGTWNASTNSPSLSSGVGTKGYYYKVSVSGSTTVDTISQWNAGDLIAFNGTTWDKIDGISSEVISVNGSTGAVTVAAVNQTMYIGTSAVNINAGSGTFTTIAGMTSITSTTFVGALTGNASTATAIAGGSTSQVLYQTGAGATGFITLQNYGVFITSSAGAPSILAGAAGVLVGSASATPTWSTTPTLTGTNFTGIPGGAINSAVANATLAATSTIALDSSTNSAMYLTWVTATSGSLALKATTAVQVNPSTGVISATGFSGSGASLTSLTAANLSGTIPTGVLGNSSLYIGTTSVALNRASGALVLTGITSIDGSAASITGNLTGDVTSVGMATTLAAATVTGKVLTGFSLGTDASQLAATDTLLQAFQKLQYQMNVDYMSGISTKTSTYNPVVVTDKFLRLDATSGAFTVTLMAAPPTGYWCVFKKIDSSVNAITISGNGKNIDGSASITIAAQWNAITLQYNGSTWDIL